MKVEQTKNIELIVAWQDAPAEGNNIPVTHPDGRKGVARFIETGGINPDTNSPYGEWYFIPDDRNIEVV